MGQTPAEHRGIEADHHLEAEQQTPQDQREEEEVQEQPRVRTEGEPLPGEDHRHYEQQDPLGQVTESLGQRRRPSAPGQEPRKSRKTHA